MHRTEPDFAALERLNDAQWREALSYCDSARLTLPLRDVARARFPEWVRERTDRNAAANRARLDGIGQTLRMLDEWLGEAGIEFTALKGVTHAALFGVPADSRVQYDIDLWMPREQVQRAQSTLITHGYLPIPGSHGLATDHLPALIRQTGWQWRGDFFDTEIPVAVELHFRFWNEELTRLEAPGVEEFGERRTRGKIGMLHRVDALGYAALHLLKHLLVGRVTPFHVYELTEILDGVTFWEEWRTLHAPGLRMLEQVAFRLAREWFGGRVVEEEALPAAVEVWFREFGLSPAVSRFHSNKDELWLHLSLLEGRPRDARSVLRTKLAPRNLPVMNTTAYIPEEKITRRQRWKQRVVWVTFAGSRVRHHAVSLGATAISGARWWWLTNGLGAQFWTFLTAAVVLNLGLFVFVLLYNLFLLDLGFREEFVGVVSSAQRLGSVAGTIPAAWIAHRFGLKRTLLGAMAGIAITEVLRAALSARMPLAALAFASGCIFASWAVALAPSIAAAVDEKRRPTAFSVFFATMFAVGIVGNWLGGRLPLWIGGKQAALFVAAALVAAALIPTMRLRDAAAAAPGERVYPRSGFLLRYLAPFALWHLATGAFNPFNNVYFARLGFGVARIGNVFSGSQLVQVLTVLMAPWITRRLGLLRGIVCMMAATSLGLCGLAAQAPGVAAVTAYVAYMSFQWMSEPGLNSLLMGRVAERERSGASALNFLVAFGAQMLAAFAAGRWIQRSGYGPVLWGAAALAVAAAVLFQVLLGRAARSSEVSSAE